MLVVDVKFKEKTIRLNNDRVIRAILMDLLFELDEFNVLNASQHWDLELKVRDLKDWNKKHDNQ